MPELKLSEVEGDLSFEQQIRLAELEAIFAEKRAERQFKRELALPFAKVFLGINAVIIVLLVALGVAEWNAVAEGREIERLVTSEVIMTVIGATTVQLGSIMFAIAKGIFTLGDSDE